MVVKLKKTKQITIRIADQNFTIASRSEKILSQIKKHYSVLGRHQTNNNPDFDIFITENEKGKTQISAKKQLNLSFEFIGDGWDNTDFFLRACLTYGCMLRNILLFHGSSFAYKNNSYLFLGPSGAGKSTIISNVSNSLMLSDDTAVLKKEGGFFYLYDSVFDGGGLRGSKSEKAVLKYIFLIKKSKKLQSEDIELEEKLNSLFYNNIWSGLYTDFNTVSRGNPRLKLKIKKNKKVIKRIQTILLKLLDGVILRKLYFPKKFNLVRYVEKNFT